MANQSSRGVKSLLTLTNGLIAAVGVLVSIVGWLAVHNINQLEANIPTKIENEVTRQLPDAVKKLVPDEVTKQLNIQITDMINQDIDTKTQEIKRALSDQLTENNKQINLRIDGIFAIVSTNRRSLGAALKKSVSGNQAALLRTIEPGRELLEHAKAKAENTSSKDVPIITQQDFNAISEYLFREFKDPELNNELWKSILEFAEYKTVANGVEFGLPRMNQYSGNPVYIGDEEKNFNGAVFYHAHIVLRDDCPLNLPNVRFVNCTFEVDNALNGRTFLKKLLTSDSPTLTLVIQPPPGYVKGACRK